MTSVRIAETDAEIAACFRVVHELRTHLVREEFVARVRLQQRDGYRLAFIAEDGAVVAAAGFRIATFLAWGRSLYVDDLVSAERARSRGHGKALLDWLAAHARANGCEQLHLDSGTQRKAAHRFYSRERLEISSFHFQRTL
jgi:GNAT superfamily N-acetyltransferase